jgi:acyl-CoA thioester hydrolase
MVKDGVRPCEVELALPVRTYDIDYAGIVSNIVYIRWLEDLRLTMLEQYFPLETMIERGTTPVLLCTDIRYHRSVRLFDRPLGRMWMSGTGKVRWTLDAEIVVEGKAAATAHQEAAVVSLTTFRPRPVPREIRAMCGDPVAESLLGS